MLLKWQANGQLKTDGTELYTQYSQLVSKLFVLSDVFKPTEAALTAQFGRINTATQKFEPEGDAVLMQEYYSDIKDLTKGYMYSCYFPTGFLEKDGIGGIAISAQIDTGTVNAAGEKIYQVFTSGTYAFYVEPSMLNGTVPVPDNLQELLNRIAAVEDDFVELEKKAVMSDKLTAIAETLPPASEATATAVKDASTGFTNFEFGLPEGKQGVGIERITSGDAQITESETITPIMVRKTDGKEEHFNVSTQNGRDGNGVFAAKIENGNLILYTQNVEGADFEIREDGYLAVNLRVIN